MCCPEGYHATDGCVTFLFIILLIILMLWSRWDASTGLGTPNFQELKAYVLQFPKSK